MSRLQWNQPGDRVYETGVDRGVLYPRLGDGVAWNGLASVAEKSDGGEISPLYYDGVKYLDIVGSENFAATLEAYSAPPEFARCDGARQLVPGLLVTQQPRETFGLTYRTLIGNDLNDAGFAYKLHLVYGCTAAPSDRTFATVSDRVDAATRSWDISTVPRPADTYRPTAHLIVDSRTMDPDALLALENVLYGDLAVESRLPDQSEVIALVSA